jgi:hypothetical protein
MVLIDAGPTTLLTQFDNAFLSPPRLSPFTSKTEKWSQAYYGKNDGLDHTTFSVALRELLDRTIHQLRSNRPTHASARC